MSKTEVKYTVQDVVAAIFYFSHQEYLSARMQEIMEVIAGLRPRYSVLQGIRFDFRDINPFSPDIESALGTLGLARMFKRLGPEYKILILKTEAFKNYWEKTRELFTPEEISQLDEIGREYANALGV
ncbi:hypothetical protein HYU72_01870, partial [Candidatus Berkelbacteria bacterium]|nr:hypothetical protein [Candidatus Berkelbacteria bacterium]